MAEWKSIYFIYPIHLSNRYLIDQLLSTRHGACHYPFNFSFGSLLTFWNVPLSTYNIYFPLPHQDDHFLSVRSQREGKNTLGTRFPALNVQKKLGSRGICRVWDFCLPSSIIKKNWICFMCVWWDSNLHYKLKW